MIRNSIVCFFKAVLPMVILFVVFPLSAQAQYSVKARLVDDKTGAPKASWMAS